MKRAILTSLSVLVFSHVVYGYVLEVNWVHGDSPVEYSLPEPQTTTSLVPFSVNFDGVVFRNQYEAEQALGGTPILTIDRLEKEIFLEFQWPPSAPFSTAYDPVSGLKGYFGPLEEGQWVFVFRFEGYLLWDYFDVIPGVGGGVKAEYFQGIFPQGNPCMTRIEPSIDNNWGSNIVACDLSDQVSVRWTADLEITTEDTYTFATNSDDGVLVWLNGALIINNWTDHGPTINTSFPFQLERGVYSLSMEWYENGGGAVAQLFWETPTMGRQIIPPGPLQPPTPPAIEGEIQIVSSIVFEDFEHYNDNIAGGQAIFQSWIGGLHPDDPDPLNRNGTGMRVGHLNRPYSEQTIVYSGRQSMPLYYNNSQGFSQADRTLDIPQDWGVQGLDNLSLQVHGQPKFAQTDEGGYVLSGAGTDIGDTSDEFRFAYKLLSGDGSMTARILSNGHGSNGWAKGGVMIRESLNPDSKHAMTVVTGGEGGGAAFQWRSITNGISDSVHDPTPAVSPPYWVRIERDGGSFSSYLSADGVNWTLQENIGIDMNSEVFVGLCVTSHTSDELRTFEFDNIDTNGEVSGQWKVYDIGVEQPGNDRAQLYLRVEDTSGIVAEVSHPDPDILLSYKWNRWVIPLNDFRNRGVNLNSVKTMSIGMRDLIEVPQIGGIKPMQAEDSGAKGVTFIDYGEVFQDLPAGTDSVDLYGFVWNDNAKTSPIHNARITLNPVNGTGELSNVTNNGFCRLRPTLGASYNINVTAIDYQPRFKPNHQFNGFTRMDVVLIPEP